MELLRNLYEIHSMSGQEKKMKRFIKKYVNDNIPGCVISTDNKGNLYIVKGKSDTYPCVVAHLDQVQRIHAADFKAHIVDDIIIGYSSNLRKVQGLGADDKNGIWVAIKCLEKFDAIKTAFFVQEEVGCVGSGAAEMGYFDDCRFVLEADRRGKGDLITSIYSELCSKEFLNDIGYEAFGYKPTSGLSTDVGELKDRGLKVACINMSCGYYEPHTDNEYTHVPDLMNCLNFVFHIIETCTKVYKHEAQPYSWSSYMGGSSYYPRYTRVGYYDDDPDWSQLFKGYETENKGDKKELSSDGKDDDTAPAGKVFDPYTDGPIYNDFEHYDWDLESFVADLIIENEGWSALDLWNWVGPELAEYGISWHEFEYECNNAMMVLGIVDDQSDCTKECFY